MPSDTPSTPPDSAPILLNAKQAAKALAISERSLWRLRASGEIPIVKIGGRVLYPRAELERWVEARMEGGER